MTPPSKKRKTSPDTSVDTAKECPPSTEAPTASSTATEDQMTTEGAPATTKTEGTISEAPEAEDTTAKAQDRLARFKALQARAKTSSESNLKEATRESQRLATDPGALAALHRKHATASHKLTKAEVEDAGGDFERKRAWDWTVEESEAWDRRARKRAARRDDNAFHDFRRDSQKVYKRQVRNMAAPDMERYARDKMAAIEKAAAAGTLEIVETDDGELVAVDKDGTFYATSDSTGFADSKPDKAAVDRLVNDLQKAEAARLKKRKERMAKDGDDGDTTHINEKNKQFNQKLSRFYNKYTAEIRDSFERGTMI